MLDSPVSLPYEVNLSLDPVDSHEKDGDAYEEILVRDSNRRLRKAGIFLQVRIHENPMIQSENSLDLQSGSFVGALGIFLAIQFTNWFPSS